MVMEFFELFKTPWEFYNNERSYDVVIATSGEEIPKANAYFSILFGPEPTSFDYKNKIQTKFTKPQIELEFDRERFPVYGSVATLESKGKSICLKIAGSGEAVGLIVQEKNKKTIRIGYDLFEEVHYMLTSGQPLGFESIPTLDIQISMLRNLILGAGIPLIEILPSPDGYDFICCLTHDVDFVGIRNHKFDHTMLGFLYRALIKTFIDVLMLRSSWSKLLKNWKAVLTLPAVYLKIVDDFWIQFKHYLEIENGLPSTFYFIPFKNTAGKKSSGPAPKLRESAYDISDIEPHVHYLISNGCEAGLHGIDAWVDPATGRKEFERIQKVTGNSNIGVRMHWLYFMDQSPKHLDTAGFFYDTTFGYNDAVGYRAGTTQPFKPSGSKKLMELPLHIQDTALFYTDRMNLSETKAMQICRKLMENAKKYGGVLTINWHHRSIAPERLWDHYYKKLLSHLKHHRIWFGTAQEVVRWFDKRRNAQFKEIKIQNNNLKVKICGHEKFSGPDLILRLYKPRLTTGEYGKKTNIEFIEVPIRDKADIAISF